MYKFRLGRTVLILSSVVSLLLLLALIAPQWHVIYAGGRSTGWKTQCLESTCPLINFTTTAACAQTHDWRSRLNVVQAFIWMSGFVLFFLMHMVSEQIGLLSHPGDDDEEAEKRAHDPRATKAAIVMMALAMFGVIFMSIATGVYGAASSQNFLDCERSMCDQFKVDNPGDAKRVTCYRGVPFGMLITATLLLFLSIPIFLLPLCIVRRQMIRRLMRVAMVAGVIAFVCIIVAGITSQWTSSARPVISIGVFSRCVGTACLRNRAIPGGVIELVPGCKRASNDFKSRLDATAAFTILALLSMTSFVAYLLSLRCECLPWAEWERDAIFQQTTRTRLYGYPATKKWKIVWVSVIGVALLFLIIAYAIYGGTMGSWITCGKGQFVSVMSHDGDTATYGISSAAVFASFILLVAILIIMVLDLGGICETSEAIRSEPFYPKPGASCARHPARGSTPPPGASALFTARNSGPDDGTPPATPGARALSYGISGAGTPKSEMTTQLRPGPITSSELPSGPGSVSPKTYALTVGSTTRVIGATPQTDAINHAESPKAPPPVPRHPQRRPTRHLRSDSTTSYTESASTSGTSYTESATSGSRSRSFTRDDGPVPSRSPAQRLPTRRPTGSSSRSPAGRARGDQDTSHTGTGSTSDSYNPIQDTFSDSPPNGRRGGRRQSAEPPSPPRLALATTTSAQAAIRRIRSVNQRRAASSSGSDSGTEREAPTSTSAADGTSLSRNDASGSP